MYIFLHNNRFVNYSSIDLSFVFTDSTWNEEGLLTKPFKMVLSEKRREEKKN